MPPKRRSRKRPGLDVDIGPPERLARGEIVITGSGAQRQGRVLSLIDRLPEVDRQTAAWLLTLHRRAQFNGYALSRLDGTPPATPQSRDGLAPTEAAAAARRKLAAIETRLAPVLWLAVEGYLLNEESAEAVAARLANHGFEVSRKLIPTLAAVALQQLRRRDSPPARHPPAATGEKVTGTG